jgi:hypothetical protein
MNLFWAIARIVTVDRHFDSPHRFKTLPFRTNQAARFCEREVDFAGTHDESFSLREMRHAVSLSSFAAPTALQTSAV